MKKRLTLWVTAAVTLTVALVVYGAARGEAAPSAPVAADSVAVGVFEGRTPCGSIAAEFTGFPSHNCEKIKWQLTLFRDTRTNGPSAFLYEGTRTTRRGVWTIQRGTPSDPNARVYRLTPTPTGKVLSLLSVDDKVLLLLDAELRVLVGDASWSYVLNRTERKLSQ